jgi:hypothetical protein
MRLRQILQRGDQVSVKGGRLTLLPISGNQAAADKWLADNHDQLLSEILELTGRQGFRYLDYTTGKYGPRKAGGLTLQLIDLLTHDPIHCVFNVKVQRDRDTRHGKKGAMLPARQFKAEAGSAFVAFWKRCGLALPRGRLSAFHDYMGKLRPIILQGQLVAPGKADKQSLMPMTIDHDQLMKAAGLLPDNTRTSTGQHPDNTRTRMPDKETHQHQQPRGIQTDLTTCAIHYEQRLNVNTGNGTAVPQHITNSDNSVDEWLAEYEQAAGMR